jgi:hypothetical protein
MAPGALPRPGRVPEQRLLSPEICLRRRRSCGTILGKTPIDLGFGLREALNRWRGGVRGLPWGPHHPWAQPGGGGAPPHGEPAHWPPSDSRSVFGPLPAKNRGSRTCFVQFQEYFLCSISETQKQQKIGNWHCGILLVG